MSSDLPGIFALLQEAGDFHTVLEWGQAWIRAHPGDARGRDVAVIVALAHCDVGTLLLDQDANDAVACYEHLRDAAALLAAHKAAPQLAAQVHAMLQVRCRARFILSRRPAPATNSLPRIASGRREDGVCANVDAETQTKTLLPVSPMPRARRTWRPTLRSSRCRCRWTTRTWTAAARAWPRCSGCCAARVAPRARPPRTPRAPPTCPKCARTSRPRSRCVAVAVRRASGRGALLGLCCSRYQAGGAATRPCIPRIAAQPGETGSKMKRFVRLP